MAYHPAPCATLKKPYFNKVTTKFDNEYYKLSTFIQKIKLIYYGNLQLPLDSNYYKSLIFPKLWISMAIADTLGNLFCPIKVDVVDESK